MGNWFSHQPQTDHEKLTLFWKHNKEGKVYAGDDSLCTNEWDRYEVGKQLCDFNDIVNYEINNVLTIHVAPLLEDQIPYKSLLKFASNWSIDQVEICFISSAKYEFCSYTHSDIRIRSKLLFKYC